MVWRSLSCLMLACCMTCAASAADESFFISQTKPGNVHVSLRGVERFCDALFAGFASDPLVAVNGRQITISSDVWGGECNPSPGPPPTPIPYMESADAGLLSDGDYVVVWTWHTVNFPMPDQSFT